MKLTLKEHRRFEALIRKYKRNKKVKEMKKYIQHGAVSTYDHVESVALLSYLLNHRFHLGARDRVLIAGAVLHDFYLYDWHKNRGHYHGFNHPEIACKNAVTYFHVDNNVQGIIKSHMWPLTLTKVPHTREAWIVCLADKLIALKETLHGLKLF